MADDRVQGGAEMIANERARQLLEEGWTADHDDTHDKGEMAWAAACYAAPEKVYVINVDPLRGASWREPWPTEGTWQRGEPIRVPWRRPHHDRVTRLVKAGALIAAEIDRLQREAQRAE